MNDMIKKTLVWLIFLSQLVYSSAALGYKPNVHVTITKNAVLKSQNIKSRLEAVGLLSSNGDIEKEVLMGLYLSYWIQRGANWEDGIQIAWGEPQDIAFCHFYNPIADKGYMSASGAEIGQSLIARSHDVTNEWSYEMAKKLYYAALIGDNSEILDNFTRMRPGWAPHLLGLNTNMTEEDRDQYFAWTLQALGHTLHLIQDASVPAHTRNDFHSFMEPYERWTNKNLDHLEDDKIFTADGSAPWASWSQHPDTIAPDVFMDTNQLDDTDTAPITGSDQGIAEYSYANFMSEDTIFAYVLPAKPEELDFFYKYQSEDFNLDVRPVNGTDMTFVYLRDKHPGGVDHLALAGVLHPYHPNSSAIYYDLRWTTDDDMVNEDYATKLIPRAVGYSAGLLDYFFRGSMDVRQIKPQGDSQWISALDFEVTNSTLLADGSTVEAFESGSLSLAYKYMLPGVSEPQFGLVADIYAVNGISDPINDDFVSVSVAFPDDGYIPADATNVTFTLVFRGRLGNEDDAVIGKVFTEPSWIAYSYRPDGWPNPSHIYTVLSDGSEREKISSDEWDLQWFFSPTWGPHGMSLAFESAYDGCTEISGCGYYGTRKIVVVDTISKAVMNNLILNDESHAHPIHTLIHPSFSPDGSQIAAAAIGVGAEGSTIYAVVVFDVQTGAWHYINGYDFWDRGITWENLSSVSWSPLGDKIAYAIYEDNDSEALNIHTISPDGAEEVQLTFGDYRNGDPSWSRDGEWIVFVSDRDGEGKLDVWSMDKNGQNMRKIINCSSGCSRPSFSPDGSKIVFSGGTTVYTADSAGSNVEVLEGNAEGPAWSN